MRWVAGCGLVLLLAGACRRSSPPAPAATPASASTSTVTTYAAGKTALEAGRLDEAEAIFKAVAARPAAPGADAAEADNALLALASLRKERGDARGALAYAQRVVERRPDDPDALLVLVELAHEAGDLTAEIGAREQLVAHDPDALEQRLLLAGALTANRDVERGKQAFLGYEEARVRLLTALGKSPDPATRRTAARRLAAAHDGGTARALVLAMTDRDPGVRAEAVRAVTVVGLDLDPEIRPALRKLSTIEQDPSVRAALDEALATPAPKATPGTR